MLPPTSTSRCTHSRSARIEGCRKTVGSSARRGRSPARARPSAAAGTPGCPRRAGIDKKAGQSEHDIGVRDASARRPRGKGRFPPRRPRDVDRDDRKESDERRAPQHEQRGSDCKDDAEPTVRAVRGNVPDEQAGDHRQGRETAGAWDRRRAARARSALKDRTGLSLGGASRVAGPLRPSGRARSSPWAARLLAKVGRLRDGGARRAGYSTSRTTPWMRRVNDSCEKPLAAPSDRRAVPAMRAPARAHGRGRCWTASSPR